MIENSGLRHFKVYHPSVKEMMSPHHYGQRDAHDCYINKALHKYKKMSIVLRFPSELKLKINMCSPCTDKTILIYSLCILEEKI